MNATTTTPVTAAPKKYSRLWTQLASGVLGSAATYAAVKTAFPEAEPAFNILTTAAGTLFSVGLPLIALRRPRQTLGKLVLATAFSVVGGASGAIVLMKDHLDGTYQRTQAALSTQGQVCEKMEWKPGTENPLANTSIVIKCP